MVDVVPDADDFPDLHGLGCIRCGGHWLEEADLHRLEEVVEVHWVEVRHLPSRELQEAAITCPRCTTPAQTLLKLKSKRDRKVLLDACGACHGVWLDGGELVAIQQSSVWRVVADTVRYLLRS
jgi:Zn-finger nucleic acid-binding protein